MIIEGYVELMYIRKRHKILEYAFDHSPEIEPPEVEVNLAEVKDLNAFINSLKTLQSVYG